MQTTYHLTITYNLPDDTEYTETWPELGADDMMGYIQRAQVGLTNRKYTSTVIVIAVN